MTKKRMNGQMKRIAIRKKGVGEIAHPADRGISNDG